MTGHLQHFKVLQQNKLATFFDSSEVTMSNRAEEFFKVEIDSMGQISLREKHSGVAVCDVSFQDIENLLISYKAKNGIQPNNNLSSEQVKYREKLNRILKRV